MTYITMAEKLTMKAHELGWPEKISVYFERGRGFYMINLDKSSTYLGANYFQAKIYLNKNI